MKSRRSSLLPLLAGILVFALSLPAAAQQGGAANYLYDANGRLITVLSPTGEAAIYSYDAAGNFTSITRREATTVSIIQFTPGSGPIGAPVTIYGTGFSATPSSNTVKFNGVTASVTSATKTQLTVNVPGGATTGLINVTTPNGTINSSDQFYVITRTVYFNGRINFGESVTIPADTNCPAGVFTPAAALLTFDGTANQRVSIMAENLTFQPFSCSPGVPPLATIKLISPSGAEVTARDFQEQVSGVPPFAFFEPVSLPATGTYSILIEPRTGNLGMTVRLYDVAPDVTGVLPASGTPYPVVFAAPGQNAVLTFNGLSGQNICLLGSQDGGGTQIVTDVKLFAPGAYPNGTPLTPQTLGASFFIDRTVLAANGVYTIAINPRYNQTRTVRITLHDIASDVNRTLTIGAAAQRVDIPLVGQVAHLNFNVPTNLNNQQVTIRLRRYLNGVITSSTLTLSTQGGAQIFTQTIFGNSDYDIPRTLAAGNYVLTIDPHQDYTGYFDAYLTAP